MNWLGVVAALSGAIAVGAGAFGAHGAGPHAAEWLKTGGHYQLVHAITALVALRLEARGPGWLFVAGGALFAGPLYALALGAPLLIARLVPIGGALLIGGWLWLAWRLRG